MISDQDHHPKHKLQQVKQPAESKKLEKLKGEIKQVKTISDLLDATQFRQKYE